MRESTTCLRASHTTLSPVRDPLIAHRLDGDEAGLFGSEPGFVGARIAQELETGAHSVGPLYHLWTPPLRHLRQMSLKRRHQHHGTMLLVRTHRDRREE